MAWICNYDIYISQRFLIAGERSCTHYRPGSNNQMWNSLLLASSTPPKWASAGSCGKSFPVSYLATINTPPPPIMFRETQTSNEGLLLLRSPCPVMRAVNKRKDLLDEVEREERKGDGEWLCQCWIISYSLADWTWPRCSLPHTVSMCCFLKSHARAWKIVCQGPICQILVNGDALNNPRQMIRHGTHT